MFVKLFILVPFFLLAYQVTSALVIRLRQKAYSRYVTIPMLETHPEWRRQNEAKYLLTTRQAVLFLLNLLIFSFIAFRIPADESFFLFLWGLVFGLILLPFCQQIGYLLQFWFVSRHPEALRGQLEMSNHLVLNSLIWEELKFLPLIAVLYFFQPGDFTIAFAAGWFLLLLIRFAMARVNLKKYGKGHALPIEDHLIER